MNDFASTPLITTIIPTYRRPQLVRRAIQSVLAQTFTNVQICIYDNASDDETASMVAAIAKEDPRVKYHCHAENIGVFHNFQYGLERVTTPLFSFLSDDDIILPHFYETALTGFDKYPDAMFSSLGTIIFDGNNKKVIDFPLLAWEAGFYHPPDGLLKMLELGHPDWAAILFRKEVIDKIGILDLETDPPFDLDFELRAAARLPFVISTEPGALFRAYRFATTGDRFGFDRLWSGYSKIIHNLTADERIPPDVRPHAGYLLDKQLSKLLFKNGFVYLFQNKDQDAENVVGVLREHFHCKMKGGFLLGMLRICRHFNFVRSILGYVFRYRGMQRERAFRKVNEQYEEYMKFLNI